MKKEVGCLWAIVGWIVLGLLIRHFSKESYYLHSAWYRIPVAVLYALIVVVFFAGFVLCVVDALKHWRNQRELNVEYTRQAALCLLIAVVGSLHALVKLKWQKESATEIVMVTAALWIVLGIALTALMLRDERDGEG